jgi:hypothetical protein
VKKPESEAPEFEKERVRLADGRELTYYRFPAPPPRPAAPAAPAAAGPGAEER